jgi:hypothetical protein
MTKLYIVLEQALAVVSQNGQGWKVEIQLEGNNTRCIAVDPLRSEYVYVAPLGKAYGAAEMPASPGSRSAKEWQTNRLHRWQSARLNARGISA